jgi:nucleoside-diphosphate-sugar epimerase
MKIKDNVIVLNKKNLEIKDQYSSNQLSKKLLNWKPAINFEKGLKETIKWYKKTYID